MLTNKEFLALNLDEANEALATALDENGYDQPEQPYTTLTAVRKAYKGLQTAIAAENAADAENTGEDAEDAEDERTAPTVVTRGPVQGIGVFAKEKILAGLTNAEVLAAVKANFPSAKTSSACIGYYRSKLVEAGQLTSSRRAKVASAVAAASAAVASVFAQLDSASEAAAEVAPSAEEFTDAA